MSGRRIGGCHDGSKLGAITLAKEVQAPMVEGVEETRVVCGDVMTRKGAKEGTHDAQIMG